MANRIPDGTTCDRSKADDGVDVELDRVAGREVVRAGERDGVEQRVDAEAGERGAELDLVRADDQDVVLAVVGCARTKLGRAVPPASWIGAAAVEAVGHDVAGPQGQVADGDGVGAGVDIGDQVAQRRAALGVVGGDLQAAGGVDGLARCRRSPRRSA